MSTKDIIVDRDKENDVLYVIKEGIDCSKTMNYQITADIVLRKDSQKNEIVGITIDDFSRVLPHLSNLDDYHLMEKFDAILEFLNAPDLVGSLA